MKNKELLSFTKFSEEMLFLENVRYFDQKIFFPIQNGTYGKILLEDKEEYKFLQNKDEVELIKMYQADPYSDEGRKAMEILVNNKMPFIESKVAGMIRLNPTRAPYREDMVQEGALALMKAIERFDVNSGNVFNAYATRYIEGAITNSINTNRRSSIDNDKGDVGKLASLDSTVAGSGAGGDRDMTVSDYVKDTNADTEGAYMDKEQRAALMDWIEQLPDQEKTAIKMHFLPKNSDKGAKLEDIASALGVSISGAKKILDRALAKLKKNADELGFN